MAHIVKVRSNSNQEGDLEVIWFLDIPMYLCGKDSVLSVAEQCVHLSVWLP